jgi:hypothetical protein
MRRGARAKTGFIQGFPLATRAQHKEDAIQDFAVVHAWTVATQRMPLLLALW